MTITSGNNDTGEADHLFHLPNGVGVRQWRDSDAASLAHHADNRNVWDKLRNRVPHPYTLGDARCWIRPANPQERMAGSGEWDSEVGAPKGPLVRADHAITVDDVAVGSIGLRFGADVYVRSTELGYWLGEEYWGKGVMSQVAPAYVKWVWETFQFLVRLNGAVVQSNVASRKVLIRAGFHVEGMREKAVFKNRVFLDEVGMAALRPE